MTSACPNVFCSGVGESSVMSARARDADREVGELGRIVDAEVVSDPRRRHQAGRTRRSCHSPALCTAAGALSLLGRPGSRSPRSGGRGEADRERTEPFRRGGRRCRAGERLANIAANRGDHDRHCREQLRFASSFMSFLLFVGGIRIGGDRTTSYSAETERDESARSGASCRVGQASVRCSTSHSLCRSRSARWASMPSSCSAIVEAMKPSRADSANAIAEGGAEPSSRPRQPRRLVRPCEAHCPYASRAASFKLRRVERGAPEVRRS